MNTKTIINIGIAVALIVLIIALIRVTKPKKKVEVNNDVYTADKQADPKTLFDDSTVKGYVQTLMKEYYPSMEPQLVNGFLTPLDSVTGTFWTVFHHVTNKGQAAQIMNEYAAETKSDLIKDIQSELSNANWMSFLNFSKEKEEMNKITTFLNGLN